MGDKKIKGLFWFRRDLRLEDNSALYHALLECDLVAPIFIFDKSILNDLIVEDRRVEFIWETINYLKKQLNNIGSDMVIKYGYPIEDIPLLAKKYDVGFVYANEDYEEYGIKRDQEIKTKLSLDNIDFKLYKDTVIFSKNEVIKSNNQPYVYYTDYKNHWLNKINSTFYKQYESELLLHKMVKFKGAEIPPLDYIGFNRTNLLKMKLEVGYPGALKLFNRFKVKVVKDYKKLRDIPASLGVSFLSLHNRFGTISIRKQIKDIYELETKENKEGCESWINELIWREFYIQLMYHYPNLKNEPFKKEFTNFNWSNNYNNFTAWCDGKTGYPLIDAAMIQLNNTGYMHNRLRMLSASFLTKHLNIDYKLGEDYFANKLLDYELACNNGNWQWCASTGCDSQPYIRIYNPVKQSQMFDSEALFIKKYIPMFKNIPSKFLHEPWKYIEEIKEYKITIGKDYPLPIVNHEEKRKESLKNYEEIRKNNGL